VNILAGAAWFALTSTPMEPTPGTLRYGGAAFNTTHWSIVGACQDDRTLATNISHAALTRLCRDYWPPLYSFVRRRGYAPADAQDLVQSFFAYFLKNKAYMHAERGKGKFRSFLLASIKHFLANDWDREHALKRGGDYEFVLLDSEVEAVEATHLSESVSVSDEEQAYQQRWAQTLVGCALAHLSEEFSEGAKARLFDQLKPFLCGGADLPNQAKVAEQLKMPIGTLRSHLLRLRQRYAELLREEVARTIGSADDVDEELRHFRKILIG